MQIGTKVTNNTPSLGIGIIKKIKDNYVWVKWVGYKRHSIYRMSELVVVA